MRRRCSDEGCRRCSRRHRRLEHAGIRGVARGSRPWACRARGGPVFSAFSAGPLLMRSGGPLAVTSQHLVQAQPDILVQAVPAVDDGVEHTRRNAEPIGDRRRIDRQRDSPVDESDQPSGDRLCPGINSERGREAAGYRRKRSCRMRASNGVPCFAAARKNNYCGASVTVGSGFWLY
jgi:hypothetical protein